jgi:hypothetical protein
MNKLYEISVLVAALTNVSHGKFYPVILDNATMQTCKNREKMYSVIFVILTAPTTEGRGSLIPVIFVVIIVHTYENRKMPTIIRNYYCADLQRLRLPKSCHYCHHHRADLQRLRLPKSCHYCHHHRADLRRLRLPKSCHYCYHHLADLRGQREQLGAVHLPPWRPGVPRRHEVLGLLQA